MANIAEIDGAGRVLARHESAHTPDFAGQIAIGAAIVEPKNWDTLRAVPNRYLRIVLGALEELSASEKAAVDAALETARQSVKPALQKAVENRVFTLLDALQTASGVTLTPYRTLTPGKLYQALESLNASNLAGYAARLTMLLLALDRLSGLSPDLPNQLHA